MAAVETLREGIRETRVIIFVDFTGVSAPEITEFRKQVRKSEGKFRVIKNNTFYRALEGIIPEENAKGFVSGPTGIILFSGGDEVPLVKAIYNFTRDKTTGLIFRGGYQEGRFISQEQLEQISKLPERAALLGQFCSALSSPIHRFLFTLKAVPQRLVLTLSQAGEKAN